MQHVMIQWLITTLHSYGNSVSNPKERDFFEDIRRNSHYLLLERERGSGKKKFSVNFFLAIIAWKNFSKGTRLIPVLVGFPAFFLAKGKNVCSSGFLATENCKNLLSLTFAMQERMVLLLLRTVMHTLFWYVFDRCHLFVCCCCPPW